MHTQKLIAFITAALFGLLSACNVQEGGGSPASSPSAVAESTPVDPLPDPAPEETAKAVSLEVSLDASSRRAERFLGSFTDIVRLTLDVKRTSDNRTLAKEFELTKDPDDGRYKGTMNFLIVDETYRFTGHAYDNKPVEIFQGETTHEVIGGVNTLLLQMAPILDNRELTVPRIMALYRPYQMATEDNATIRVRIVNTDLEPLKFHFKPIEANSFTEVSANLGGGFAPALGTHAAVNGSYPFLQSIYTAPAEEGQQRLLVTVTNDYDLGVSVPFTINLTGPTHVVDGVQANPVPENLIGTRIEYDQLHWRVTVSDDDSFSELVGEWSYEGGYDRSFASASQTETVGDTNSGIFSAVMTGYQDSDNGTLVFKVTDSSGDGGFTELRMSLEPNAYPWQIVSDEPEPYYGFAVYGLSFWQ